jgi:hypothetical protein
MKRALQWISAVLFCLAASLTFNSLTSAAEPSATRPEFQAQFEKEVERIKTEMETLKGQPEYPDFWAIWQRAKAFKKVGAAEVKYLDGQLEIDPRHDGRCIENELAICILARQAPKEARAVFAARGEINGLALLAPHEAMRGMHEWFARLPPEERATCLVDALWLAAAMGDKEDFDRIEHQLDGSFEIDLVRRERQKMLHERRNLKELDKLQWKVESGILLVEAGNDKWFTGQQPARSVDAPLHAEFISRHFRFSRTLLESRLNKRCYLWLLYEQYGVEARPTIERTLQALEAKKLQVDEPSRMPEDCRWMLKQFNANAPKRKPDSSDTSEVHRGSR